MSQLYYSENGMVVPTLCEELTCYRHALKILRLPPTRHAARLFLSAYAYPGTPYPLHIAINGNPLPPLQPSTLAVFHWYEIPLPAGLLRPGENLFEFWTDATAMNAWSLALEGGAQGSGSQLSTDGGKTWRSHHLGYLNAACGEYLVRVRLEEGQDPEPPAWTPEDPNSAALKALRRLLPAAALEDRPALERVRALAAWISAAWEYRSSAKAAQYAPWDIETILAWGQARRGHDGQVPIVMCVHYGVAFVTACQAAGLAARAAVFTQNVTGFYGHFTAEVWLPEFNKWVYVDPNADALAFKDGLPLSIAEVRRLRPDLGRYVAWGPGIRFQANNPEMKDFVSNYDAAPFMDHRSLWWRADFLSNPQYSPPGHGSLCYCETGLVWEKKDLEGGMAMFPYFGDEDYFNAPPS